MEGGPGPAAQMEGDDEEKSQAAASKQKRFQLAQRYPIVWVGGIILKSQQANILLKFMSGDVSVAKDALPSGVQVSICIKNKLKFEKISQQLTKEKMREKKGCSVLLALPSGGHSIILQRSFIEYFRRQRAAGVVEFPQETPSKYEMFIFPSSDFVYRNLSKLAPEFTKLVYENRLPHLLFIINTIGNRPGLEKTETKEK